MHLRLPLWTALFAFFVAGIASAQTPAAPAAPAPAAQSGMQPGQIVAKKVVGTVSMTLNGKTTVLHNDDPVSQLATVATGAESSIILVFSNGATTQLGADTTLSIDEFMQDPFKETVAVANLQSEPTKNSHTKLRLAKGELIGQVAKLHLDNGSYYTVETPVGAAGIRGTTFRIVFRPTGNGQAFVFALSTVEGNVGFHQGATGDQVASGQIPPPPPNGQPEGGNQGQGQGQGQGEGQGQGQGSGQGQGGGSGVAVTTNQEIVVTVTVDVDPKTGKAIVTSPPTITSTVQMSTDTRTQILQQAQDIATTQAQTTFQAPPSTPNQSTGDQQSQQQQQQQGDQQQSQQQDSNPPATPPTPPSPPPPPPTPTITTPTTTLTPGAGN